MVSNLINANPTVYEKKERRARTALADGDEYAVEHFDQLEIFDHLRDIKDPEHPYSLEELKVITEDAIEVDDERNYVRVTFTPTVEHCSMATVIGLCLRLKLMRSLPLRYKGRDSRVHIIGNYGGMNTRGIGTTMDSAQWVDSLLETGGYQGGSWNSCN
ncbi:protein AE7-like isoform X2 [Diospyros lotus]|uniref:protein AE7-like isoform X2 n=1 Tax=Diospyros lotus TaxID=55363 RepID=UPI00224EBFED|nr:protein AE7-like isoform X2 [Diospyros lotus]